MEENNMMAIMMTLTKTPLINVERMNVRHSLVSDTFLVSALYLFTLSITDAGRIFSSH
jgi:hypothetical protein